MEMDDALGDSSELNPPNASTSACLKAFLARTYGIAAGIVAVHDARPIAAEYGLRHQRAPMGTGRKFLLMALLRVAI
jgi:hypothetical protein